MYVTYLELKDSCIFETFELQKYFTGKSYFKSPAIPSILNYLNLRLVKVVY